MRSRCLLSSSLGGLVFYSHTDSEIVILSDKPAVQHLHVHVVARLESSIALPFALYPKAVGVPAVPAVHIPSTIAIAAPRAIFKNFSAKKRCGHSSASELSRIPGGGRACCARFWPFGLTRTMVESPDMKVALEADVSCADASSTDTPIPISITRIIFPSACTNFLITPTHGHVRNPCHEAEQISIQREFSNNFRF